MNMEKRAIRIYERMLEIVDDEGIKETINTILKRRESIYAHFALGLMILTA